MTLASCYVPCEACRGYGKHAPLYDEFCKSCNGLGRVWAPGAPGYGCKTVLSDYQPGEVVELGTGERCKIMRTSRCSGTMVVAILGVFDGVEGESIHYPNEVGVISVDLSTMRRRREKGGRRRNQDLVDPLAQRKP